MAHFYLRHPPDPRPSLVAQTCTRADQHAIEEFKELLHRIGCPDGLLFDASQCLVVHDSYSSMGPNSLRMEAAFPTDAVLAKLEQPGHPRLSSLDARVGLWVDLMSSRWEDAIADDPEIEAALLADVVPAAVQAIVSTERGSEDAA
ncbi:MAG: hypothetical protein AAGF11_46305 [Myxococcota bacterium]